MASTSFSIVPVLSPSGRNKLDAARLREAGLIPCLMAQGQCFDGR